MSLKQLRKSSISSSIFSLSCYVVHEKLNKKQHYFKIITILCYFRQSNCQEKLVSSKLSQSKQLCIHKSISNLPHVEQKYIEALSRLSQLAQGGFSALDSSISCRISMSAGGREDPSFNIVCCLEMKKCD
jgi:hypothetical protein